MAKFNWKVESKNLETGTFEPKVISIEYIEMAHRVIPRWSGKFEWEEKQQLSPEYATVTVLKDAEIEQWWFIITKEQREKIGAEVQMAFVVAAGCQDKRCFFDANDRRSSREFSRFGNRLAPQKRTMEDDYGESNSHYHAFWER